MNLKRVARVLTPEVAYAQGYVRTPGGFRHKSMVHEMKPRHVVVKRAGGVGIMSLDDKQVTDIPLAPTPPEPLAGMAGGWVTWASWSTTAGAKITSLSTSWVVPPPPSSESGQLVYFFNGLQDDAGDIILQPVLQWGVSGAGGGQYWGAASWHVDSSGHAFYTPVTRVSAGGTLTGVMTLEVQADGSLIYTSAFSGLPGTSLVAQGLPELTVATQTLEVYGLTKASDYPDAPMTAMSGIDLQVNGAPATPQWVGDTMSNPGFGEHTSVVSNASPGGEVDLFY
jgi:hypothetical protein